MQATAFVSLTAVKHNFLSIRQILPPRTRLFCVVKANAYGHGALPLAKVYSASRGISFAVAHLEEAIALREGGITSPILILGHTSHSDVEYLLSYHITPCIHSYTQGKELHTEAQKRCTPLPFHLKINSGMHRLGFTSQNELEAVLSLPYLQLKGIYTHYAQGDMGEAGADFTHTQYNRFLSAIQYVQKRIPSPVITHAGNSGATLDFPHLLGGGARVGILLYGVYPSPLVTRKIDLQPVMTLSAPILHIRTVPPLTPVGYGGFYVTPTATKLAYIPLGYADGVRREWCEMGVTFTVNGTPCPLVGRVCMDSCTLDVTRVQNVSLGDRVTLFGDGGQDVLSLATRCHTIPYEILTAVGERVKRVYLS